MYSEPLDCRTRQTMSTGLGCKPDTSHQFKDIERLAQDMRLLATMPEVYDVHFIVGKDKECVGGVKAILAARSRVFFNMLFGGQSLRTTESGTPKKSNKKERNFAFLKRESQVKTEQKAPAQKCLTIPIEDFEVDEFAHLMEFLHCGRCVLDSRCIVGILAGADFFAVEDLHTAVVKFVDKCITVRNVCTFFCDAEKYIQLKSIKALVPKLLEFTATHAHEILGLASFRNLPQHVVRLIMSRKDLNATEWEKFTAVVSWGHAYSNIHNVSLQSAVEPLIDCITFYKIPTMQLMQEVRKRNVVPDHVIMKALAYQADPMSVKLNKAKPINDRPANQPKSPRKTESSSQACIDIKSISENHQEEVVDVKLDHLTKG
ncbi:serine-enriched protein-like [Actinia tenebrosa]|uniref:Serine-enriched protein-like n=1 Tax=Actinia tenebrosa TaxID=6105 RepID=A0A6P8ID95_ACTTE|nr:serine-enriched protein-like [Actinia tenebrosa]